MKKIHLCSIVREDLNGPGRLSYVISTFKPDVIAIGANPSTSKRVCDLHTFWTSNYQHSSSFRWVIRLIANNYFSREHIGNANHKTLSMVCGAVGFELWLPQSNNGSSPYKVHLLDEVQPGAPKDTYWDGVGENLSLHPYDFQEEAYGAYNHNLADADPLLVRSRAEKLAAIEGQRILHLDQVPFIFGTTNIYDALKEKGIDVERLKLYSPRENAARRK